MAYSEPNAAPRTLGPFRTDFLTADSLQVTGTPIADYDQRRADLKASFNDRNGLQPGDPRKLADAMVVLAGDPHPPMRFTAGTIAWNGLDTELVEMKAELDRWRTLSLATDGDYPTSKWTTAAMR